MDGQLTWLNRGGRVLAGWGEDETITGKRITDLHPEWVVRLLEAEAIPAAIREGTWQGATAVRARDGREVPVWQEILSIGRGWSGGYLSTIMRDISARVRRNRRRRRVKSAFRCSWIFTGCGFHQGQGQPCCFCQPVFL